MPTADPELPTPLYGVRPAARRGRPLDAGLTGRMREQAVLLVANHGFAALTAEVIARRTGAGKAGVYRRWRSMADLIADALTGHQLTPAPPPPGPAHDSLRVLLQPFTAPLTTAENAAAALIGPARTHPVLATALHHNIVAPLTAALADISRADAHPTTPATAVARQRRLLQTLTLALWWHRYITAGPVLTPTELDDLIQTVLLPVLR